MRIIDADKLYYRVKCECNPYGKPTIDYEIGNKVLDWIDNAPTVERPHGEWIIDGHHYKCSRCGKTLAIMFSETDDDDLIGCPFCLADMRVKDELGGR